MTCRPRRGARLASSLLGLFFGGVALAAPASHLGPPVVGLKVGPIEKDQLVLTLILGESAVPACTGHVRGTVTFFDASPGASMAGPLVPGPEGCQVSAPISYDAFSVEAIGRARGDVLEVRFVGERTGQGKSQGIDWKASVPRAAVQLTESMRVTLRRFTKSPEIHLGGLGVKTTKVNADVELFVPLRFNLKVIEVRCEVEVNGKNVASGEKEKFIVYGGRANRIRIPVSVNNGAVLSAAGSALVKGGKVDGKMTGLARLRLPGGDVDFPLEFPVKLSLW